MDISFLQILLLSFLAFVAVLDSLMLSTGISKPLIVGTLTGLLLGDIVTGMTVGATLELMILGVGTYGGASIPDYMTGAIVGTVFAILSGKGVEFGIGLAVPVGLLMVQLDILARFSNVYFQRKVELAIEEMNFKSINLNTWLGMFSWGLSRAIPVFLMLYFGQNMVDTILNNSPDWLLGGLKVAGGLLPAVGLAILLRYLPVKENVAYLLIGFFLAAYLEIPMVGVSIIGFALALIVYNNLSNRNDISLNKGIIKEGLIDGEFEN